MVISVTILASLTFVGCAKTPRTATNFCRQLVKELPGVAETPVTPDQVITMLERYRRLGLVAPLEIEENWQSLVELLNLAAQVNTNDPNSVQAVVDMAYSTQNAAQAAAQWILKTCAIDISSGLEVVPNG